MDKNELTGRHWKRPNFGVGAAYSMCGSVAHTTTITTFSSWVMNFAKPAPGLAIDISLDIFGVDWGEKSSVSPL